MPRKTQYEYIHIYIYITGLAVQELARHAGFVLGKAATQMIDHFHKDSSDSGKGTLIALDTKEAHSAVVGPKVTAPILYNGMAFTVAPRILTFPILKAPTTAYTGTRRVL